MNAILKIGAAIAGTAVVGTVAEALVKTAQKTAIDLPSKVKETKKSDKEYIKAINQLRENRIEFVEVYDHFSGVGESKLTNDDIFEALTNQATYINSRFDCSDFRLPMMFLLYNQFKDKLEPRAVTLIEDTFKNFKYFMDEPGDDSMCFWSENHQILFAVNEYLAGQQWAETVFTNNGMTGEQHKKKAEVRIRAWMSQRFNFGFSEYLSNTYLAEDIGAMANFINFADDADMVEQMKIIMDILWLDVALTCVNNRLAATSTRMYANNKVGNFFGNSVQASMNLIWGEECLKNVAENENLSDEEKLQAKNDYNKKYNHISACFDFALKHGKYTLPTAIKEIATSTETFESKMCCGLSPQDMKDENLIGQEPHQIMAQLGAETFTNPEVIKNTLKYFKENGLYSNLFVFYFKYFDLKILKPVNFEKFAKRFNLMTHGIALGRGNIYTYRTKNYSMSTSIKKDVDMCGAQEHIWTANIAQALTVFTTHPAGGEDCKYGSSPGYWIGNGRRPMSVQNKNVNITTYKIPKIIRPAEFGIAKMTHAYMPKCFYDEFELENDMVLARKNGVFVAMIASGELKFKPYLEKSAKPFYKTKPMDKQDKMYLIDSEFDLCLHGEGYHTYITEISDIDTETFEQFKARIRQNKVEFLDNGAIYSSMYGEIKSTYDGEFTVDGEIMQTQFMRYDSKFCQAKRKAKSIEVKTDTSTWVMDFDNAKRCENI